MDSSPQGLLTIYLNDHMAGSVMGAELSKRAAKSNEGTQLGVLLGRLAGEIEADRDVLGEVMDTVGAGRDKAKQALAWAGEKVGRLKPNGQITGYSNLSRLVELEGLSLGLEGKAHLWASLAEVADPRLTAFDFAELEQRAERQRDEIEPFRLAAAASAMAVTPTR